MTTATWNGVTIAQSEDTVLVEGNHYFPLDTVDPALLKPSTLTSVCPWKGTASYYTLVAGGAENPNAAWCYPSPKEAAKSIDGRIAFWKGVQVV